jgi:hypothetical protein
MMTRLRALPKMGPAAKIGLVVTGYVIALLVAMAVVAVYVYLTDSPDRDLSSGMHAFGDSLLFLTVLTLASIPATGAARYFQRPHRAFWIAVSVASLAYAATAIPAVFDHFTLRASGEPLPRWSALLSLRLVLAPFPGFAFFFAGLFAPSLWFRVMLFGAMVAEAGAFSALVASWFIGR